MNENKHINISDELDNLTLPWIEYLVENYKNSSKINSCLDVASENIRLLESLINQAQNRLKDFQTLKQLTLSHEQQHTENNNDLQLSQTHADMEK